MRSNLWECYHCKAKFSNPETMGKHIQAQGHVFESLPETLKEEAMGWQGLESSGYPKAKNGRVLWSDLVLVP